MKYKNTNNERWKRGLQRARHAADTRLSSNTYKWKQEAEFSCITVISLIRRRCTKKITCRLTDIPSRCCWGDGKVFIYLEVQDSDPIGELPVDLQLQLTIGYFYPKALVWNNKCQNEYTVIFWVHCRKQLRTQVNVKFKSLKRIEGRDTFCRDVFRICQKKRCCGLKNSKFRRISSSRCRLL